MRHRNRFLQGQVRHFAANPCRTAGIYACGAAYRASIKTTHTSRRTHSIHSRRRAYCASTVMRRSIGRHCVTGCVTHELSPTNSLPRTLSHSIGRHCVTGCVLLLAPPRRERASERARERGVRGRNSSAVTRRLVRNSQKSVLYYIYYLKSL